MSSRFTGRLILCAALFSGLAGCAQVRTVTLNTRPAGGMLRVDQIDRGVAPVIEKFVFNNASDVHTIIASRPGYKDMPVTITRDFDQTDLTIELKPQTRQIRVNVQPVPGVISIDGKPIGSDPSTGVSRELEFTLDSKNAWTSHKISVDRPNFQPVSTVVRYDDHDSTYTLNLLPLSKKITVTTDPPGADVYLDFEKLGAAPLKDYPIDFPVDLDTNEARPRKLRAERPGYDPITIDLNYDSGKTDYRIDLAAKTKTVHFATDPKTVAVKIDGADVPLDPVTGQPTTTLQFPPTNERGDLKTYTATISKKTADSEWEPQNVTIGWENGRSEYLVHLKEILTRPVPMLWANFVRADNGWSVEPKWTQTVGMKDVTEGPGQASPQQMTRLAAGTQIGSMALSPNGSRLVLNVLSGGAGTADFRSQMIVLRTDGTSGQDIISDGRSLDLMPTWSPGGDEIVFSSNRAGRKLKVWSMAANGSGGVRSLTTGDTNDLWPCMDSDPKPRLFYEALVDTRPDTRLYMTQLGTIFMTDMTNIAGAQPRISPSNDSILFSAVDEKSGKRDIYRMSDRGGTPENLTGTSDADDYDATWSKDGSKVLYASDAVDEKGQRQSDIWLLDLSHPGEPIRVTRNGSIDDCPIFDATGNAAYFRSNRGGQWQVWKINLK